MNKTNELTNTSAIVMDILTHYPIARDSDTYLYLRVVKKLNPDCLNKSFVDVISNLSELGLPCFETVRRSRQKIQQDHPALRGSEKYEKFRADNEEIFKEFARG